ncbi:MAG TPA: AAA family ATPase [Phycisphaerales bacterium]|nr:AAA family ATPase [Phycisphaerales bacterium]
MRTIAIINQKGGCGKTTTAINLAAGLARQGRRTLLIDMDPQSHCAAGLGIPEQRIEMDIGDAMLAVGQRPIDPTKLLWRAGRNLDLAPSRMRLAGLEAPRGGLADLVDKDKRLANVLTHLKGDYDVCCIDCPPSIGLLTYNALAAADTVLIPVETSFFSLQGANRQLQTVKTIARRLGVSLPVWVLPTIHDNSNAVAIDLLEELYKRFKEKSLPLVIRRDAKLREAASFGQSILDYSPESAGAEDYLKLAQWVAENLKPRGSTVVDLDDDITADETPAPAPVAAAPTIPSVPTSPEVKPISRAEDVARRAQEFLRRVALGKNPGTPAPETTPTSFAPVTPAPTLPTPTVPSGPTVDNASGGVATLIQPPATTVQATPQPRSTVLKLIETPATKPAPVSPSTHRLLGVRETNQGVLFVQPLTLGDSVSIAASFNNWNPTSHVLKANPELGVWELCVKLPPGKHTYRLVIDGQWCTDPYNDTCEPNPFGETNSAFTVGAPAHI